MRRRDFVKGIVGSAATWPLAALAQQSMPVIGFLRSVSLADAANLVTAFREGLKETGYIEGQNVAIADTKPNIPPECQHLNYLLATPFRYGAPHPRGSRFRKAGRTLGVFYCSENVDTAVAEMCFRRFLFFAESPDTTWPADAGEFTAFAAEYATPRAIDLTRPPFDDRAAIWMHVTEYGACQALAELARAAGIELIKYPSARDPRRKLNVALLTCRAFARAEPSDRQSWRILFGSNGARAFCEMPREMIDFDCAAFADDPRIAAMRWDR